MSGDEKAPIRAEVSHELCTGTGECIRAAPHAFRYNKERLSIFKDGSAGWTLDQLREAADSCPMSAITIIGDDG